MRNPSCAYRYPHTHSSAIDTFNSVTYINTSSFAIYLIPWAVKRFVLRRAQHANDHSQCVVVWSRCQTKVLTHTHHCNSRGYEAVAAVDTLEAPTSALISNFRAPSINAEDVRAPDDLDPLTTRQTAQLASVFCLFWFIANWSVNASLQFTSVASATVLSSTSGKQNDILPQHTETKCDSGFFTLTVGRLFRVETLTLAKILAVVTRQDRGKLPTIQLLTCLIAS